MNHALLRNLFLSSKESRDLAEFLSQKKGIEGYENMSNDHTLLGRQKIKIM